MVTPPEVPVMILGVIVVKSLLACVSKLTSSLKNRNMPVDIVVFVVVLSLYYLDCRDNMEKEKEVYGFTFDEFWTEKDDARRVRMLHAFKINDMLNGRRKNHSINDDSNKNSQEVASVFT